jgi:hypothetical protein
MKRASVFLTALTLVCAIPSWAQTATLQRLPDTGETVAQLLARHLPRSIQRAGAGKRVIGLDGTDQNFIIDGAGSIPGNGGTYFRSDVTIANYRGSTQYFAVGWLKQGIDSGSDPVQYFSIPPNQVVSYRDFVAQTIHQSGLGSIIVFGQTSSHGSDSGALLDGNSRIWTNQPGSSGSVSLGFAPLSLSDLANSGASNKAYVTGLRQDSGYRTNTGIVNLDNVSHTWTVRVNDGSTSFTVTVPAFSMQQVAISSGNFGDLFLSLQADSGSFFWSAYGVSVDNTTGDGWVSHAVQP